MNKDVKKKWVAALRSDDYAQGKEVLREKDKFCCLGVLCDIAVKEGVISPPGVDFRGRHTYDEQMAYLPHAVQTWADLPADNPRVTTGTGRESLALLNDGRGYNFREIADIIEEQL